MAIVNLTVGKLTNVSRFCKLEMFRISVPYIENVNVEKTVQFKYFIFQLSEFRLKRLS